MAAERYVTRKELAEILGYDERTITNRVKQHADYPSRVQGKTRTFPVRKCVQWERDHAVADAVTSVAPPAPDSLTEANRRRAIADAELAELKLAEQRGEVAPVEKQLEIVTETFSRIRARVLGWRGEYASRLVGLDSLGAVRAVLDQAVLALLHDLHTSVAVLDEEEGESDAGSGTPGEAGPDTPAGTEQ